jgi:polyribonucleotide nucleotidyltransferase
MRKSSKICKKCNEDKILSEFKPKKQCVDGYENICKECDKKYQKEYREKNKDKIKNQRKRHYSENKAKIKEKSKNYYYDNIDVVKERISNYKKENKDKINEYNRNYMNKNKHVRVWRNLIYKTIEKLGTKKENHTIDELGYSALDLKNHIKSLFTDGMSWDNHGEWHVDHIKPISKFNEKTPIKEVNALNNLQPLWGPDNLKKGSKYQD